MLTDQLKERKMSAWNGDLRESPCWYLVAWAWALALLSGLAMLRPEVPRSHTCLRATGVNQTPHPRIITVTGGAEVLDGATE